MSNGAGHGFLNFGNANRYRPKQATDAWEKMLGFLDRQMKTRPEPLELSRAPKAGGDRAVEDDPPPASVREAQPRGVQTHATEWIAAAAVGAVAHDRVAERGELSPIWPRRPWSA